MTNHKEPLSPKNISSWVWTPIAVIGISAVCGQLFFGGINADDAKDTEVNLDVASARPATRVEALVKASAHSKDYTYTQIHMAMPIKITVWTPDERLARTSAKAAFKRVAELDKIFSDYDPESELRQLTSWPGPNDTDESVPLRRRVSPELARVVAHAKDLYKRSAGAFDPTAGPIIRLWRQARKDMTLPDDKAIQQALNRVDMSAIEVNAEKSEIRVRRSDIQLDLGAIAKGFIADEAIRTIRSYGINAACVEAGGDFVLSDAPPGKRGWEIDIPFRGKTLVKNCGVSVSGDTSQFVVIDSIRYSHVVDPRTGNALTNRRMTVVIAPTGIQSDSLATTGCIMEPDEFMKMISEFSDVQYWQYTVTPENEEFLLQN